MSHFVWFDLMSTDPEGARAFYTKVAGWSLETWEADPSYTMWGAAGVPVGGVRELPAEAIAAGAPTHWLGYITVPDIAATTEKLLSLGGEVLMSMAVPAVGAWVVFKDPQGVVAAAFTPTTASEHAPPTLGHFSWHELMTTDLEAGWAFYRELFGWQVIQEMKMGEQGIYRMYGPNAEIMLGGMMGGHGGPPGWLYYIKVVDLDASLATVKELGGKLLNGPTDVPGGGRVAQCMDPQGGAFALHSE